MVAKNDLSLESRLTAIDALLARSAERCDKARPLINEARELLTEVRAELVRQQSPADKPKRGPRAAATVEHYRVESVGRGWALAEYRSSRPQPFRCPPAVFNACVNALARADRPLKFDEVRRIATKDLGAPAATYLFRIALRFLVTRHLVEHWQTRFRPTGTDLKVAAIRAWDEAKLFQAR